MRAPCTFRLESVSCGKETCRRCLGTKPAHGPYWYAYWETGGRARPRMQKRYIGKASATATPEELRALFELRQQRRAEAEAEDRKRRRDTRSDTSDRRTSSTSGGSATGGSGSTSGGSRDGRSYRSARDKTDPFSKRRPPPIEEDFEVIGSKRGASFEQARQAYKDAARKHHPDAGGDPEVMKRVNAAWDRVRKTYGR